jgi:hypothetical protein
MMGTSRPLELLHMALFGPTTYKSIDGNKYGFGIVDGFSIYTWVLYLNDKSEVFNNFKSFVKRSENEFEFRIKKVRNGNGSEFRNSIMHELCDYMGIKHELANYSL